MRFQISTIMLGLLVSAMGCATCGNSMSCCDSGSGFCDAPMECCVEASCCDPCGGGCDVIYDGPYLGPVVSQPSCSTCNGGVATTMSPVIAAPSNTPIAGAHQHQNQQVQSQVSVDTAPAAPSLNSIVQPRAVPAPEPTVTVPSNVTPKPAAPTKPVKNILPSIISDGT